MFIRFGGALVLVVLVSLVGIRIEKRNLELRRQISSQHFRMDVLQDRHTVRRIEVQRLGAPARCIESLQNTGLGITIPTSVRHTRPRPQARIGRQSTHRRSR